jgi:hypothetical protein
MYILGSRFNSCALGFTGSSARSQQQAAGHGVTVSSRFLINEEPMG